MDVDAMRERNQQRAEQEAEQSPARADQDAAPIGDAIEAFHARGALAFGIPAHRAGEGDVVPDAARWAGARGGGATVNVGSINSRIGAPYLSAYVASKFSASPNVSATSCAAPASTSRPSCRLDRHTAVPARRQLRRPAGQAAAADHPPRAGRGRHRALRQAAPPRAGRRLLRAADDPAARVRAPDLRAPHVAQRRARALLPAPRRALPGQPARADRRRHGRGRRLEGGRRLSEGVRSRPLARAGRRLSPGFDAQVFEKSAAVMPSGWAGGHCTSSIRFPSGSVIHAVRNSSEPSGDAGGWSGWMPAPAISATTASIESTLITK